jgi:hypothetical protein
VIESLEIKGFRCFEHLRVPGLTRVNLIVGKNNSGKTSLLEAVELLHLGARALARGPIRRREEIAGDPGAPADADVSHLFHGHELTDGARFTLEAGSTDRVLDCRVVHELDEHTRPGDEDIVLEIARHFLFGQVPGMPAERVPLTSARGLSVASRRAPADDIELRLQWLGPDRPRPTALARLWAAIVLTDDEAGAYSLMRASGLQVERVAFDPHAERGGAPAWVRLAGDRQRQPLGSLGDGATRLLSLGLHLAASRGGVLLVDEIDTGLHHSVMAKMWQLVISTARRLHTQVFATTHSEDCVRALAEAAEKDAESAADISLHRIDPGETETMPYSADRLIGAIEHHIEVR